MLKALLRKCYENELAKKPSLRGTVQAQFVIDGKGQVIKSEASGVDPAVASCIAEVIKKLAFPALAEITQVSYPITFRPATSLAAPP